MSDHSLAGYYRSLIQGFAERAYPLTKLLKKDVVIHWGKDQDSSFTDLKHPLTHAPVLTVPNFKDTFLFQTDANLSGIGAVLMQMDERGRRYVIVFDSLVLLPAEKKLLGYPLKDPPCNLGTTTLPRYYYGL